MAVNQLPRFKGNLRELESAFWLLRLGHHVGWKVLYIVYRKRTIRHYEEILGMSIRELFEATGPTTHRSNGYRLIESLTNSWKAISGEREIPDRQKTLS